MTVAVILAGGRGSRISEETGLRPKPMIEIGGRPILWHIMKTYAHHGVTEFVICLGYKGHAIKEYFTSYRLYSSDLTVDLSNGNVTCHQSAEEPWKVTLVDTGDLTETGGRLLRAARYLPTHEPFCLTYGDGVADVDIGALLRFHAGHGGLATVTAVQPPGRFGALAQDGDRVTAFVEKPAKGGSINGGYFVFDPAVLHYLADDSTVLEREPLEALAGEGQLFAYEHEGFWQCCLRPPWRPVAVAALLQSVQPRRTRHQAFPLDARGPACGTRAGDREP